MPQPWIPEHVVNAMKESFGTFVLALLMTVCAITFTFIEDWCRAYRRPEWMVWTLEKAAFLLYLTDLWVIGCFCAIVVVSVGRFTLRRIQTPAE